jgi:hypothetical protein
MNTDKEKAKEIEITAQAISTIELDSLGRSGAIVFSFSVISLSLSVFICVHPWFQSIYPTDASR